MSVHDGDRRHPDPAVLCRSRSRKRRTAPGRLAADPHWRRIVEARLAQRGHRVAGAACRLRGRRPADAGTGIPRRHRAAGRAAPADCRSVLWGWPVGYQPGPAGGSARWDWPDHGGTVAQHEHVDASTRRCRVLVAAGAGWVRLLRLRPAHSRGPTGSSACSPGCSSEMLTRRRDHGLHGPAGCEVELLGEPGSGRRTLLAQLAGALEPHAPLMDRRRTRCGPRATRPCSGRRGGLGGRRAGGAVGNGPAPGALTLVAAAHRPRRHRNAPCGCHGRCPPTGRPQRDRLWAARTGQPASR